jgi:hypothetical protein
MSAYLPPYLSSPYLPAGASMAILGEGWNEGSGRQSDILEQPLTYSVMVTRMNVAGMNVPASLLLFWV